MDLFRRVREGTLPVDRVLAALQGIVEGNFDAAPQPSGRIVDCDGMPFVPDGWTIRPEDQIASRVRGQLEWNPDLVRFHLEEAQRTGTIVGAELRGLLKGKPVLPAHVLDHLLANTRLIPESWKQDEQGRTRYVFFWGTIYRDSDGDLFVRYLYWRGGQWRWHCDWLVNVFGEQSPSVLLAS